MYTLSPLMLLKTLIGAIAVFLVFFSTAQVPSSKSKFIVIAHRGNHQHAPENTLKAFEEAIQHGVDYVEVDLRTTKDGKLVVMHDETVDRMTNGKGNVADLAWNEIQKLKVMDKQHPELGNHYVPTFNEVLNLCKNKIYIYLDFKDASVIETLKAIRESGMERSIVVYINSEQQHSEWRKEAPNIPLMISLPKEMNDLKLLRNYLSKVDAEIIDGAYKEYTREKVTLIQEMGRKVWADIQQPTETFEIWEEALNTGFGGLQTDHPEDLISYLTSRGKR